MGFKGKVSECRVCNAQMQFLPTDAAPRGAWVDAGTKVHHRCGPKSKRIPGRVARPCWACGESVQCLPTPLAAQGAWVDAGTLDHHRCGKKAEAHVRAIVAGDA